jgi:MFS family permease
MQRGVTAQATRFPTRGGARWWRIMPILFITFSFAYLDRVNFGFALAGGITRDLNISAGTSSLVGALFFLGYFTAQIPGAVYAESRSARKIVCLCLVVWGGLSALTGVVSNIPALMAVRFLLGVAEAGVFPALIVFINHWFTRDERSLANTFVILSSPITIIWMSVLSGYLVQSFGWRMMLVAEGLPSAAWGIVWWLSVRDYPAQASWLPAHERQALEAALAAEQRKIRPVRNYREAFLSPLVIRFSALYFFWGLGLYGFTLWLPSILREAGSDMVSTGWLSAGPYVFTAIVMLVISRASDRTGIRKPFVWPCLLTSAVAFILLFVLRPLPFGASYTLLTLAGIGVFAGMPTFFAILPEYLPRRVAGGAVALINSFGALGGFAGSYLVGLTTSLTGNSSASFLLMGTALLVSVTLLLSARENSPSPAA